MKRQIRVEDTLIDISEKIENINKTIENILPRAIIRQTTQFGNSSHVVLSKEFLDKRVGVIVLEDLKSMKGGEK